MNGQIWPQGINYNRHVFKLPNSHHADFSPTKLPAVQWFAFTTNMKKYHHCTFEVQKQM